MERTEPSPAAAASPESTPPRTVEWMRKRDGEMARFDLAKLTRSLQFAADDLDQARPLEAAVELARMAAFFLASNATGRVVSADEVADWTEKSLLQTGQESLSQSYSRYRGRKLWAQRSLVVCTDSMSRSTEPDGSNLWDKSKVVQALRVRLKLDAKRSREIAGQVERAVLSGKFSRVTTDLIREMINNELGRWGLPDRLTSSSQVHIRTTDLKEQLAQPGGPTLASRMVAGKIWRDFALTEIVSRDVAEADRRGLVRIHGLESPSTLAASCIDCAALVRQSQGSRDSIARLGAQLAHAAESSSAVIALDLIESWLTMVAEPNESPAKLADMFWQELHSRLRTSPIECVLNLYGGMPQGVEMELGAGPLFSHQPLSFEREFAGAIAQEILGRFQRDGADWPNLRADWHWYVAPDPVQSALVQRILRVIAEGLPVAIVFDRGPISLCEGIRRVGDSVRPVLEYVGVSLPLIWRDAGCPHSLPALEDGLLSAIQLAVRSAVQKREFVRRLPHTTDLDAVDHAVTSIFPIGLDWTVRQLVGKSFAEDEGALKLAETLVRYLREAAERESRFFALSMIVDNPVKSPAGIHAPQLGNEDDSQELAGMVPCIEVGGQRRRLHAAGRLHAISQAGTLSCHKGRLFTENPADLINTLEWACRNTELVRLRLLPDRPTASQAMVNWPEP